MVREVDTIVLGQGLAGTAVGWWLFWSGQSFVVVDSQSPSSASRVAAGLVTPITGRKLVKTWRFDMFWPTAVAFYRRVENETGKSIFRETNMVRLFASQEERSIYDCRRLAGEYESIRRHELVLDRAAWRAGLGGFEADCAGKLAVVDYLDTSREFFSQRHSFLQASVNTESDIEIESNGVFLSSLNLRAKRMIFCLGYSAIANPWFRHVKFKPAKGEILTLRIPSLREPRAVHRGVWLAAIDDQHYQTGSTYQWNELNDVPTDRGREEIESQLREFLMHPYRVVQHQAAIRPIHVNQYPVIGIHPELPSLSILNGLGSKGTLQSPWLARHLVNVLMSNESLDPELDLLRKPTSRTVANELGSQVAVQSLPKEISRRSLVAQAQSVVGLVIKLDDIVIDVTAGNGHDTKFLAQLVGPRGRVYAFDVQVDAIRRTTHVLKESQLTNVVLCQQNHAEMIEAIPEADHKNIAAVMFNLGYLPGGDKSITTQIASTLQAMQIGLRMLRPGGVMTIIAYTGHHGGAEECAAVLQWIQSLDESLFSFKEIPSQPGCTSPPRLFVLRAQ